VVGDTKFEPLARDTLTSSMWAAVEERDRQAVDAAVAHGMSLDMRDDSGRTILFRTVATPAPHGGEKEYTAFVRALCSMGCNPNAVDNSDTPMICYPMVRGSPAALTVTRCLLDHGADVAMHVGATGDSVVSYASQNAVNTDVVDMLVAHASIM